MTNPQVEQITAIQAQLGDLRRRRVTLKKAEVTAVDDVALTFTAVTPTGEVVTPLASPEKFLPEVGDEVTIQIEGATPTYLPGGIALNAISDREVSSLSAGLLSSDTMTANLTLAAQILTATSGQRAGLTPIGIQAWDDDDNPTVILDGNANLIQGSIQTAPDGSRRVIMGAAGTTGRMAFIAPDGSETEVEAYTSDSGVEAIRVAAPISEAWEAYNGTQFQANERAYMSSKIMQHIFTAPGSEGQGFVVSYASNNGAPGVQPTRTERFTVGEDMIRHYVGTIANEGSIDILQHGVADSRNRSPKILFRAEGGTQGNHLKYVVDSGPANPRLEVTDTGDSAYAEIWASDHQIASSADFKQDITDAPAGALAKVRGAKAAKRFRLKVGMSTIDPESRQVVSSKPSDLRLGLVVQELPAEVVGPTGETISQSALNGMLWQALGEAGDLIADLTARVAALEGKIK